MPTRDYVEWANREVSVFDVLTDFFGIVHPRSGTSYKGYCPWKAEHPDPWDKGFRTYPESNSAYCFQMHGKLTPVRLLALSKDWRYERAARFLLDHYGLLNRPWRDRWSELQTERATPIGIGDPQQLITALHDALRTHPNYPPGGVSSQLSRAIESEMDILDRLLTEGADRSLVEEWFRQAKQRLTDVLDDKEAPVG